MVWMPSNRITVGFCWMLILPVTPLHRDLIPAVRLDLPDDISDLHYVLSYLKWNIASIIPTRKEKRADVPSTRAPGFVYDSRLRLRLPSSPCRATPRQDAVASRRDKQDVAPCAPTGKGKKKDGHPEPEPVA